jgi:cyclopropane-fatty-acyl-phospholipid synthase
MNTHPTLSAEAAATLSFLDRLFLQTPLSDVAIRLWDGTLWPDAAPRAATLELKHPGALRAMLSTGTAKGLAEAYLRDDIDVTGDIEAALEVAEALESRPSDWRTSLATYYRLHRLPSGPGPARPDAQDASRESAGPAHSLARDRHAIAFHYDISNAFYQLWLDRQMVYSCAYFARRDEDLDTAQHAKLSLLCRKLRLRPGQHLLDIGCGWGGLAIHAAKHFGVKVTGITLSGQQASLAAERVRAAGLESAVKIELRDYRELPDSARFDAIVSVGMSEHVGRDNLAGYFKAAASRLRPGGVFLNHAIGEITADRFKGPSFVDEYVFPDGDVPGISLVLAAAESAGLEVRDVENLREHYTLTLRHWVRRLEQARDQALTFVNEPTFRVWRLYMAGSAHGFEHGHIAVYQALLAKPDPAGHAHLPLTRNDWYA